MWTAFAILASMAISAVAGVVSSQINKKAQEEANETNLQLNQEANSANIELAREEREFNSEEAEKNRQFQLEMSNTAHQREVADLKAAGLNPYASVESLNGAAVTGGAVGQGSSARVQSGHVDPVYDQSLGNIASIAQSAAFMMALQARTDTLAGAKVQAAKINGLSRAFYH